MTERTTAYIVTFGNAYEPAATWGVFGSHEKAEAFCSAFMASPEGKSYIAVDWTRTDEEDGSTCWDSDNHNTELKINAVDWEPEFE